MYSLKKIHLHSETQNGLNKIKSKSPSHRPHCTIEVNGKADLCLMCVLNAGKRTPTQVLTLSGMFTMVTFLFREFKSLGGKIKMLL